MTTVYLPAEHKDLSDRLARRDTEKGGKPVFQTYMQIMLFSAMVGYSKSEARSVKNRGPEIDEGIFVKQDYDGVAYLLALHTERNGDILRESRDHETWRIIQDYAAAGLDEIDSWVKESPSDVDSVNTILSKMKEKAASLTFVDGEEISPDVEF